MSFTIVGLGEILWDMLPSGKQLGGAPANFAYHAQELGDAKSVVVSCVGNDVLGKEVLSRLKLLSLSSEHITVDKEHPTGTVRVEMDDEGNHSFTIEENVAWDYIPETPSLMELAEETDVVCFGSLAQRLPISRNTIQAFLKHIATRALCLFDINLRRPFYSKAIIKTSLSRADILKANDDELSIVASLLSIEGSVETVLEELAKRFNLRLIALTKGENGSILYSNERKKAFYHSGCEVEVVDLVGAGDAFAASIAVGMLKGYDFDYINECANRVAAFVCTQSGATPRLPDEIKHLFKT